MKYYKWDDELKGLEPVSYLLIVKDDFTEYKIHSIDGWWDLNATDMKTLQELWLELSEDEYLLELI